MNLFIDILKLNCNFNHNVLDYTFEYCNEHNKAVYFSVACEVRDCENRRTRIV